jgi:hypothetical protein
MLLKNIAKRTKIQSTDKYQIPTFSAALFTDIFNLCSLTGKDHVSQSHKTNIRNGADIKLQRNKFEEPKF